MIPLDESPQVRTLERSEIDSILARNCVGRLAFSWSGRVDIRPIHYVFSEGRIYGRTSYGEKFVTMRTALPGPVALEVDEIESRWRWRSVIVRADFHVLTPDGSGREEWTRAMRLLRGLERQAFTISDPFPARNLIFRIDTGDVTGRAMG